MINLPKIHKILLAIVVATISTLAVFKVSQFERQNTLSAQDTRESTASVFEDLNQIFISTPKKLIIKSVGINADIVGVGVTPEDVMGTPKDWKQVGWFDQSGKVAQYANIVLNGHYDTNTGSAAVFYRLKNVKFGDKLSLIDADGRQFEYQISDIYYVDMNSPERFDIFKYKKNHETVTLITCGGVFLPSQNVYNKRLIVRAQKML